MQLPTLIIEPVVEAKGLKVGIVRSRFNAEITTALLASAVDFLCKSGVAESNIKVVTVAGSVEIPFALQKLAQTKKHDCLVAIGCVIRGETPHFEYVCKMAQEGTLRVMLDFSIPIGFGVLTVNSLEQARARLQVGEWAARAAAEGVKMF